MNIPRKLRFRLRALFRGAQLDREMDDEMRFHLEMEARENAAAGAAADEAHRRAAIAFGGRERVREEMRDARGVRGLEHLARDLAFAARSLAKHRGFTFLTCLILTLGVAGNVIIFSLVNALYLRPLPFPDCGRLVDLDETAPKWNLPYAGIRFADFNGWREHNKTFDGLAVWSGATYNLSTDDVAERVSAQQVTHDLAATFAIKPVLGRMFTAEEENTKTRVALLADHMWRATFGGSESVLGRTIQLDGEPFTVIGVLPPEAMFPDKTDLWVPLIDKRRNSWFLRGVGRLKPGVSAMQAQADLKGIHQEMDPKNDVTSPVVQPLRDRYVGNDRPVACVLLAAVIVVLLISCANVAGLMLARALGRSGEFGLRAALGASRFQIVRLILSESLLVTLLGATGGVLLSHWLLGGYLAWLVRKMPGWVSVGMDFRVIAFVVLLVGLCTLLAGLVPARHVLRRLDIKRVLAAGTQQATASASRVLALRLLVVGEIAMATLLLISAGLLGQAFLRLQQVNPGFQPDHVLKYDIGLPTAAYRDGAARERFFAEHLRQLRDLPGVVAASACDRPPLLGHRGNFFERENAPPPAPGEQSPVVLTRATFPGYFETMRIALVAGRSFTELDGRNDGSRAAIVNETLARQFWPGEIAVGKRLRYRGSKDPWTEVIGVAGDVKQYGIETDAPPGVYFPFAQDSGETWIVFVVRTDTEPTMLVPAIRTVLHHQDATLALSNLATMTSVVAESQWVRRMYSGTIAVFALAALVMSIAGVYGVIAHMVGQRTREVGIRMAMGAPKGNILRLVLRDGLVLIASGLGLGLIGGVLASQLLGRLLAGVNPFSPLVYFGFSGLLAAIALLACLIPARRAMRLNVVEVLRSE